MYTAVKRSLRLPKLHDANKIVIYDLPECDYFRFYCKCRADKVFYLARSDCVWVFQLGLANFQSEMSWTNSGKI